MAVPHVVWAGCSYAAPQPVAAERLRLKQRIATSDDRVSTRPRSVGNHPREVEYPSFDGFYNNLGQPDLGGHDLPLKRYLRPAYADGVQALSNPNGPNPRLVSMRTMAGAIGTMSQMNRTVMLTHYGQHIVEELVNAMPPQCTTEYVMKQCEGVGLGTILSTTSSSSLHVPQTTALTTIAFRKL